MVNEIDFTEESEVFGEQKYSINEIILRHIKKISDLSCKEFTGGYWDKRPIQTKTGIMFYEIYHEDVREAYCNAVDFLIDILYPMGDDDFREYLQKQEKYDKRDAKDNLEEIEIKEKLKLKRQTFRQINKMFSRIEYFKGSSSYSE